LHLLHHSAVCVNVVDLDFEVSEVRSGAAGGPGATRAELAMMWHLIRLC